MLRSFAINTSVALATVAGGLFATASQTKERIPVENALINFEDCAAALTAHGWKKTSPSPAASIDKETGTLAHINSEFSKTEDGVHYGMAINFRAGDYMDPKRVSLFTLSASRTVDEDAEKNAKPKFAKALEYIASAKAACIADADNNACMNRELRLASFPITAPSEHMFYARPKNNTVYLVPGDAKYSPTRIEHFHDKQSFAPRGEKIISKTARRSLSAVAQDAAVFSECARGNLKPYTPRKSPSM